MLVIIAALIPSTLFASSIHSSVEATSDTGGNSVGEGGAVVTGEANSSASVHTVINGADAGGTADIEIRTTNNGAESKESRHIAIPAGGSFDITVATSSSARGSAQATSTAGRSALQRLIERMRFPSSTRAISTIRVTMHASSATTQTSPIPAPFSGLLSAFHEISSLFSHLFSTWSI